MFVCLQCNASYSSKSNLTRHERSAHKKKTFQCFKCDKNFYTKIKLREHKKKSHTHICGQCKKTYQFKTSLLRHEKLCHPISENETSDSDIQVDEKSDEGGEREEEREIVSPSDGGGETSRETYCETCGEYFNRKTFTSHLRSDAHITRAMQREDEDCYVYQTALKNKLIIYRIPSKETNDSIQESVDNIAVSNFVSSCLHCLTKVLTREQNQKQVLKFRFNITGLYRTNSIDDADQNVEECSKNIYSDYRILTRGDAIEECLLEAGRECQIRSNEFQALLSGWSIIKILFMDMEIAQVNFTGGSSYLPLPEFIIKKRCCINVQNLKDSYCFLYAILSDEFYDQIPDKKRTDVDSYKDYMNHFKTGSIRFPITLPEIKLFEKLNEGVSVNVFGVKNKIITGPLYLTAAEKERHYNLLLLEQREKTHYVCIRNMSRFIRSSLTKTKKQYFYCNRCIHGFPTKSALLYHKELGCGNVVMRLPLK